MSDTFFETDLEDLRNQILTYHSTSTMIDTERAKVLGLPLGCRIREGAKIISQENLLIGEHCWVGENAILDASGGLKIGSHVSIGLSVFVWTHDSHKMNKEGNNRKENNSKIIRKPTEIGDNVFIAGHSVIMPGVRIGKGCIVAPMSVVSSDLPDNTVYTPYRNFLKYENRIKILEKKIKRLESQLEKIDDSKVG